MLRVVLVACVLLTMTACYGPRVEVPPAHRGKVLTSSGYQPGLKNPSSFTLPYTWITKPQLVLAEVSDVGKEEDLEVFMPKDKLKLSFDVRGTFAISDKEERIESIFDRVTPVAVGEEGYTLRISFKDVYKTYAEQVVRRICRETVVKYSIEDVMTQVKEVSAEMEAAVRKELEDTPIICLQLGIANMQPPQVIVSAQEKRKKREIEIEEAEADKLVKLKEAQAALEVAKKQQEVDLLEAETQVLVDKKLAEGVTEAFIVQRALKALDKIAERDNVIIVPMEALRNPATLIGITEEAMRLRRKEK